MLVLAAGNALEASPGELVEAAAAAGFGGVGLRLSHGRSPGAAALRELAVAADALGVVVHDVEVHRVGDGTDPTALIEAAVAVGARRLLAVSDLADTAATVDAFAVLARQAAGAGLEVGIEYMAWTNPSTPGAALEIARRTGCTVVADVLHHHRVGAGPEELRQLVASGLLGWVQLCDAPASAPADLLHEARHARLPPGQGALPLDRLFAEIPAPVVRSVEVQSEILSAQMNVSDRAALLARASAPWAGPAAT